jgi:cytochrome c-type biogenesis protein CcmH/NrfG
VRIPGLDLQQDPLTLRYVQRQLHRPVTASQTHDYWMERTRDWVHQHPGRTLQLFLWKQILFWNRMSIPQVEGFDSAAPGTALWRPPFWRSFYFLPLALLGTFVALWPLVRRRGLDAAQRTRVLLAICALVYSASIAIFFVTDRYRVPILPCVMILAVCGLASIAAAFTPGRRRTLPCLALGAALCIAATDPARLGVDRRRMQRDLHVHTALRYAQARQFDAALHEYQAALALDPRDADVRDGWARMLGRAGRDSLALDAFHDLLRDQPNDARTWYNLGNLERRLHHDEAARAAYERALALEPDREAAWNHLGEVYRAEGDTAQAAACYRRALAIVPAHEPALSNLAALRAQQGHVAEAEAGWRAALAVNPRHLPSLVNLAILLTDAGRKPEAVDLWQRVLNVDPGNATAIAVLRQLDPNAIPRRRQPATRRAGDEE